MTTNITPETIEQIYDFIIKPIRDADQKEGKELLKRFLKGPQTLFAQTLSKIENIKHLFDVDKCPDEFLPFLARQVGLPKSLTRSAIEQEQWDLLRKLVKLAAAMWKHKGTAQGILYASRIYTNQTPLLRDWFDHRWLVSGSNDELDEDSRFLGENTWLTDESEDPYTYDVGVVDNDQFDQVTFAALIELMRPMQEKVNLISLQLWEPFDEGLGRWDFTPYAEGAGASTTADHKLQIKNTGTLFPTNIQEMYKWKNYVFSSTVRFVPENENESPQARATGSLALYFYLTFVTTADFNGFASYCFEFNTADNKNHIALYTVLKGTRNGVDVFEKTLLVTTPFEIFEHVPYNISSQIQTPGDLLNTPVDIKCFVDGDLAMTWQGENEQALNAGGIALANTSDEQSISEFDNIMVMGLPGFVR